MPDVGDHIQRNAKSRALLQAAREKAREKTKYDSEATRRDLARLFEEEYGKPPYEWQIDVSEALILGLDCIVIAGTGAGKTIPFMMPLLLHREKFVLIISPLKILQGDQEKRFSKMGLPAAAVNGDTFSRELKTWLRSDVTGQRILGVIVDEAHCMSQWGGDFRPHYALLNRLRSLVPVGIPFLATTATAGASALTDICKGLNMDLDDTYFLNLGNDRPNITPSIVQMKGSKDYDALNGQLPDPSTVHSPADLPKTITFTNAIKKTQVICRHLRRLYPNLPRNSIDFLHAHRSAKAKRRIMKQFRKGKIRILVATEAAGMGADIPDIELIIQFGVPSSLSVWIQRAGRAGRSPHIRARAIMLVEVSMFQRVKRRKGANNTENEPPPEAADSDSSSESDLDDEGRVRAPTAAAAPTAVEDDGKEWKKKVDPTLREYIETKDCRRDMTDKYFANPPRLPPTGPCCDNCVLATEGRKTTEPEPPSCDLSDGDDSRPQTPNHPPSNSAHSTPSKNTNSNGKRPMTKRRKRGSGPSTRRAEHLKEARESLETLRRRIYLDQYSTSAFTHAGIMPDQILTSLARKRVDSVEEMLQLKPQWMLARRHGQQVLDRLRAVDEARAEKTAQEKRAKKAVRTQATAVRAAERAAERSRQKQLNQQPTGSTPHGTPRPRRNALASSSVNTNVCIFYFFSHSRNYN
ncbi:P-loop containing nucleoside triphosphate hydrolase protein [Mycena rebaudengoi]|nr:P-loop containing nucleoside triphosphate hydrolase protein [Mycena rebaudengoi]